MVGRYEAGVRAHSAAGDPEMRIFGLALAGVLTITAPFVAHANEPGSNGRAATNARTGSKVVLAWDGGGSDGHSGANGGRPPAGRAQQWNRGPGFAHWGPNHVSTAGGVPMAGRCRLTGSGFLGVHFDYPFVDWRGPTGGWGNP